jgi:hypothetical protein
MYKVFVPLWNKEIVVPFIPDQLPGHFYFPAYKNQRVLLALEFQEARISRFLDWGEGTRLPADGQGNHLLLGKDKDSQTSIQHVYVDGKPQLNVKRVQKNDTVTLLVQEGLMSLTVKEVGTATVGAPTFDVTLQVEGAKGELKAAIGGSVAEVSTKFGVAEGVVTGAIGDATSEVVDELDTMEGELNAKMDEAKTELESAAAGVAAAMSAMNAQAAKMIAELKALSGG